MKNDPVRFPVVNKRLPDVQMCSWSLDMLAQPQETLELQHKQSKVSPQGADPPTQGKNHLNDKSTPLLPTGIGWRYSQTISNLGHTALSRGCELHL
jgi:hypothetical protein